MNYVQPQNNTSKTSQGFSLIETLVAISILLTVTTSIMVLVSQSIDSSESLSNRLSASYLASDAIEYLRYNRDTYWLSNSSNEFDGWVGSANLDNCRQSQSDKCTIDTRVDVTGQRISQCSSCGPLRYNTGTKRYGHNNTTGAGWEDSKFTRTIQIQDNNLDPNNSETDEVIVTVTVEWPNRSGATSSLALTDTLTAWGD
jgi:prepilin-type N-terminal cleavage/methylation domain-containing protein